jgi:uncharacterized protein
VGRDRHAFAPQPDPLTVLLVDTNIWLEAADQRAAHHDLCRHLVTARQGQLASPTPVLAETAWIILDRLGPAAQARFLRLVTSGRIAPIELTPADWERCVELVTTYATLKLDIIDASIVAIAERLDLDEIATMNGRDFYTVRPKHTTAFKLLPENISRY